MNIKSIALALTLSFVAAQAAADKVVGYYPYWSQYSQFYPKDIRYNTVTNVHYSFIAPAEDASLAFADENDAENFKTLVQMAKENNVKVIVGVGGMENEATLKAIASSEELLPKFVSNIQSWLSENGGDGVEPDWQNLTADDAEDYAKILLSVPGKPLLDVEISSCNGYNPYTYVVQGTRGCLRATQKKIEWRTFDPEKPPLPMA